MSLIGGLPPASLSVPREDMKKQLHSPDIADWLRLIRADGIGPVTFARLIDHFGSVRNALAASVRELTRIEGIGATTAERIARTRRRFDPDPELRLADSLGVRLIHLQDPRYPPALKAIPDPPPVLYVRGDFARSDSLAVAIVGSRRCSLYGQEQASRLAHFLAAAGFTIVSGLARGIDAAAHQGALAAGGRTIAVQGCGLANVFPPEHKRLFQMIAETGACISELPLQAEPLAEHFPPRNRIIAALSLGTVVIEAGFNSGALITARAALDYNREVMAVPGKVDSPLSRGCHQLLKQGAVLVESAADVTEALGCITSRLTDHVADAETRAAENTDAPLFDAADLNLDPAESAVHQSLGKEPLHVDELIAATNLPAGRVNAALISLRLKGLIKQLPGNLYVKK